MSEDLRNIVEELYNESCIFNANDVLVNAVPDSPNLFFFNDELTDDLDVIPRKIINDAKKIDKESGVNSLCLVDGFVSLELNNKQVLTPILLTPLEYKIDAIRKKIHFIPFEEASFVNPFLLQHLSITDATVVNVGTLLTEKGLHINDNYHHAIGNFHHHRYQIVKELSDLLQRNDFGTNIPSIFGFNTANTLEHFSLSTHQLFPSDIDHDEVFKSVGDQNVVIQGPPGTGKSQVLTNTLSKLLSAQKNALVVSEKRAALEVLVKKLSHFDLDRLCFIATSDRLSHTLLSELKANWDWLESRKKINEKKNLGLSEQYIDNLQMTLDLIAQEKLIGGVSYHEFLALSAEIALNDFPYSSSVPEIEEFVEHKNTIQSIYDQGLNQLIGHIRLRTLKSDQFCQIDNQIASWKSQINELSTLFNIKKWADFDAIMKEASDCQIFENDLYQNYSSLFEPNSSAQKKFLRLYKKYKKAKLDIERLDKNQSEWKTIPSLVESKSLLNSLEKNPSFFERRKLKKRWSELSQLPISEAVNELIQHISNTEKIIKYSQIIIDFCELGLENPEVEIPLIKQTIETYTQEQWDKFKNIPVEKRELITHKHTLIFNLYSDLKAHFIFEEETGLISFLQLLENNLSILLTMNHKLTKLSNNALRHLQKSSDFDQYKGSILASHWVRFEEQFPRYSKFSMASIHDRVEKIIAEQKEEANNFSQVIKNQIQEKFNVYHELLNTPSRKLTTLEKELKVRLRKGKSILVKEFKKTRSHPTLRELYQSEAKEWIQLLKPIWLSNPSQLAKCFPFEPHLFDYAIFDEASQIPVQNALGTLFRSKRIIVAGDENQMGPSSYFLSAKSEPIDLLHQAMYHWKHIPLHHHYRSHHPDLIAFSNHQFYGDKLNAFPTFSAKTPIRYHFLQKGRFINRKNEIEAKKVADEIEVMLEKDDSIGVVAFSEEQLNCIWNNLTSKSKEKFENQLDANKGFFKSLENVQGDECDHLIISFGYAPNEKNEFHLRFGPMNTLNGRKRLNVLLTRAIKQITFVCSVQSSDFKLSENESINLLRKWFLFIESYAPSSSYRFPFNLHPTIKGNTLTIDKIQDYLPNAKELVTLQSVLENRGWKINYT